MSDLPDLRTALAISAEAKYNGSVTDLASPSPAGYRRIQLDRPDQDQLG